MTVRPYARAVAIAVALIVTFAARPARAQTLMSIDWFEVDVVHVKLVAVSSGGAVLSGNEPGISSRGSFTFTDRLEIEFDYLLKEMKMRGQPTFRNFPASAPVPVKGLDTLSGTECPAGRISGVIEATVLTVSVKGDDGAAMMNLNGKWDYPAAEVPIRGEGPCGQGFAKVQPNSESFEINIVPLEVFKHLMAIAATAMMDGQKPPSNLTADGKSFTSQPRDAGGWVFTWTPTKGK